MTQLTVSRSRFAKLGVGYSESQTLGARGRNCATRTEKYHHRISDAGIDRLLSAAAR